MGYPRITARQVAREAGCATYQGKPCPHGHPGLRRTCNKHCVECDRGEKRANSDYYVALHREHHRRNPERARKWCADYAYRYPERIALKNAKLHAIRRTTLQLLYYEQYA